MIKRAFYFICTIIVLLAITYISIIPGQGVPLVTVNGLIKHFLAYAVFGFFIYKTLDNKPLAFLLAGTYGLMMEIVQLYAPTRCFDIYDILANYGGAFCVFFLIKFKKKNP